MENFQPTTMAPSKSQKLSAAKQKPTTSRKKEVLNPKHAA
jgi:hypothetical protein